MNATADYQTSQGPLSEGWRFDCNKACDSDLEEILNMGRRLLERRNETPATFNCFESPSSTTPRRVYKPQQQRLPNNLIPQALGVPPLSPSPMNHHPRIPRTPGELKRRIDIIKNVEKTAASNTMMMSFPSPLKCTPTRVMKRGLYGKQAMTTTKMATIPKALGCVPPPSPTPRYFSSPAAARTTIDTSKSSIDGPEKHVNDQKIIVKGLPASMGTRKGTIRFIHETRDFLDVKDGDILVLTSISCPSMMLNVETRTIISRCGGICTELGGMLSQAAIAGRDYDIPTVVGCQSVGIEQLQNGDFVKIDGSNGLITVLNRQKRI